ncbi:MAG: S46 family peptidase [Bacteroidota bacterium]|nr:S46 family peptidase [Bacteroidota bacterium]
MKKTLITLISLVLLLPSKLKADEGMWFLMFIGKNIKEMEKMGLKLTAEDIYSINNSSLKDAIVQFDGGCTAEIISKDGLLLTNHHCGFDKIAELSTPQNDYLTHGFWAKTKAEELAPKSISVRFFVRMDNVTDRILAVLNDNLTEKQREQRINQEIAKIQSENDQGGKYTVSVRSFFQGNEFYYFVYQDYKDVRLVGTPPDMIGRFGGDTDNWEWPRHTGDFTLFRIYTDAQGNPAEYSPNNIPMKPKHALSISLGGVKEGDYAMILGYPGRTNRWMPSGGIEQNVKFAYPAWVEGSKVAMDAMKKHMDKDLKVRLDYASSYARIANYWKNRQGMIDALTQHNTAKIKAENEAKFNKWANKKKNKKKYGKVIDQLNDYYAKTNLQAAHDNYLRSLINASSYAVIPYRLGAQLADYAKANEPKRLEMRPQIEETINQFYNTLYTPLERDVLVDELNLYAQKGGKDIAPYIAELAKSNNGNLSNYVDQAIQKSIFATKENITDFLNAPNLSAIENDELFKLSNSLLMRYRAKSEKEIALDDQHAKAFRLLVQGLRASKLSNIEYPDANSTLRLTYGKVIGLPNHPTRKNDAKSNYYTTLKGTIAKHNPDDEEFNAPQKLIDLYKAKDYGIYANEYGELPVNFLTDNDITGGNSGSPVLNGKGELIGLAFDGNIEAMAGDVIFDKQLQRTINVDIRYVLYIIDKYADAAHLIEEMEIVK